MKKSLLAGTFIAGIVLVGPSAYAQTTETATTDDTVAPAEEVEGGIQDIVVTAQRKSENLQRAPIAITAIDGDDIREAGIVTPQSLTTLVPALQVISGGTYPLYYLRGVGNFNGNPLSDSAVAVNFNDVYIGRPTSTYGLFYDLERVEVLKGPQGTLYGRNATGGSINVLPRKPRLGEFGGEASLEYGNYDTIRFDAAANIPISDKAAARVAGIVARHDGYLNNGNADQNDVGARLSFLVEPTPDLTINLSGDYYSQKGNGAGSVVLPNGVKDRIDITSPAGGAFFTTQPVSIAGRNFNALSNNTQQNNKYWGASANVSWTPEWGSVTFIPAYRAASLDFVTNSPGFQIAQREKDKQFSAELRIASNEDNPLRWLVGGFYFKEDINVPLFAPNLQYNVSFLTYKTGTESSAAFGRLTYEIADNFRVSAAGRYTHEKKFLDGTNFGQNRLCVDFPAFNTLGQVNISGPCPGAARFPAGITGPVSAQIPFNPAFPFVGLNEIYGRTAIFQTASIIDTDDELTVNRFTWRLAADWEITPQNLLYANFETGFKAGGFFFTADDGTYAPEKIKAFTVGSKNRFFDNKLQLNVEGFYWRYSDQQISFIGQDSQRNFILPTRNVGKANYKGIEIETQFALTDNTLLKADVQYLDAVYKSFVYQIPNQGPPATGCQVSGLASPSVTLNCSGFRPPNAPKWTVNLGAEQTIPLAGGANIVLNGRGHYQSDTLVGLNFLPTEVQDGYWQVDGSVTFNAADDRFYVTAFINNAFDKRVITGTNLVGLGSFSVAQLNNPQTYGLRAGFKF